MRFRAVDPYSCPKCGSEDASYTEDEWDACENKELLRRECFKCGCKYTIVSRYEAVEIVKKEGWYKWDGERYD